MSTFTPNRLTRLYIEPSSICNLRCWFCAYKIRKFKGTIMSLKNFKDYINQAVDFGYSYFGLTPMTGEVFTDPGFVRKLRFLDDHLKVKGYKFYTNLTLPTRYKLNSLRKLYKLETVVISLYGETLQEFIDITGGSEREWNRVQENLPFMTNSRFDFKVLITQKKEGSVLDNWGGLVRGPSVKDPIERNGSCTLLTYKNMILADGRVNPCACRDADATLCIGDLKESPLKDILFGPKHLKLIEDQHNGTFTKVCKVCSLYRSEYSDLSLYHGL